MESKTNLFIKLKFKKKLICNFKIKVIFIMQWNVYGYAVCPYTPYVARLQKTVFSVYIAAGAGFGITIRATYKIIV